MLDYCVFDTERDGKSKLDHVNDMLDGVQACSIAYKTVLMDSWYSTT